MSIPLEPLEPIRAQGRWFSGERKVRLGDVTTDGRLRFDALARYAQDISDDDTFDAGLSTDPGWVVRSTVIDELVSAKLGEWLSFTTFCSGLGRSWAERRHHIVGAEGAHYEVATLWICVDTQSGRPCKLTDQFHQLFDEAAGGRKVRARLQNPELDDASTTVDDNWQLRRSDFDVYGHVNNAAYWAAVEEWLQEGPPVPRRGRVEHGDEVKAGPVVVSRSVIEGSSPPGLVLWLRADERTPVTATVRPLPPGTYGTT